MRTIEYLLQSDPDQGPPTQLNRGTYSFDLGVVGAVAMKELIQTCRSASPMTALIRGLLAGTAGQPLIWRDSGPGMGWEMRTAWSGLFGRFFARAYLEQEGYTWFHPIQRSYDLVTDDLAVFRIGPGEIADWICAKDATTAAAGELIIVEAKGRHREGHDILQKLPRSLRNALDQIKNTLVWYRDKAGIMKPKTVKGYAILTKWTNENKGNKTKAILRVVDPKTSGYEFDEKQLTGAIGGVARAHVSSFLLGLGFEELAQVTSPAAKGFNKDEATHILMEARHIIESRRMSAQGSPELEWMNEESWKRLKISESESDRLVRAVNNYITDLEKPYWTPEKTPIQSTLGADARSSYTAVGLRDGTLHGEALIGRVLGVSGVLSMPLSEVVPYVHSLPGDLGREFLFVGMRAENVSMAVKGSPISEWQVSGRSGSVHGRGVYAFRDGTIIAPVPELTVVRSQSFI